MASGGHSEMAATPDPFLQFRIYTGCIKLNKFEIALNVAKRLKI